MSKDKKSKKVKPIDFDEMLESESIVQYMIENGGEGEINKFYETHRSTLESGIRYNTLDLDFTKTTFIKKLAKYQNHHLSELTDQEIADDIYYLDLLSKQIETIQSIRLIRSSVIFRYLKLPSDMMVLKEKYIQSTEELINLKQSIHERLTQLLIDRVEDVRKKIANGELIPNYDDEDAGKKVDKINLVYKRLIDEFKFR